MNIPFVAAETGLPTGYDIVDSPIGRLLLTGNEQALTGLFMLDTGGHPAAVRADWIRRPGGFQRASEQLAEYFAGSRTEFDLPLAPSGSPFQLAVWAELARIPLRGDGQLRRGRGRARQVAVASRAVGLANGRNPISIIVPCHRVIGADGSLTGYGGGLERKEWLLRHEGAPFGVGRRRRGRPGQRAQSDLDHRAVPPADRRGRLADRLRLCAWSARSGFLRHEGVLFGVGRRAASRAEVPEAQATCSKTGRWPGSGRPAWPGSGAASPAGGWARSAGMSGPTAVPAMNTEASSGPIQGGW